MVFGDDGKKKSGAKKPESWAKRMWRLAQEEQDAAAAEEKRKEEAAAAAAEAKRKE